MYSDVFCKVYNEFGWNYYPEIFGEQLLQWLEGKGLKPETALDMACGTGILSEILHRSGIAARGMDFSSGMIEIARNRCPEIPFDVADMRNYQPGVKFDLVTCTGDSLNHMSELADIRLIFRNVHGLLNPGGYFVFDLLNEREVSTSEPFEMDFDEHTRVWFQMTRPAVDKVTLTIRVYEDGKLSFEENIRETLREPALICRMLTEAGLRVEQCSDSLLEDGSHGTTWFVVARKAESVYYGEDRL